MADENHCLIAVHGTRDNKLSRKTINEYISWILKFSFVAPLKYSPSKMKLTSHSVKWILQKCGDLENYMFDERDFEKLLSKAGFPGGFVASNYDSRFIVAHVSMCKVLPVELSHMILTFIPGTWHEEKSRFHVDKECRYCWRVFKSFSWPTHLKSNVHQARLRKLAIPAYMNGKLPLSKDIGAAKRRSGLLITLMVRDDSEPRVYLLLV